VALGGGLRYVRIAFHFLLVCPGRARQRAGALLSAMSSSIFRPGLGQFAQVAVDFIFWPEQGAAQFQGLGQAACGQVRVNRAAASAAEFFAELCKIEKLHGRTLSMFQAPLNMHEKAQLEISLFPPPQLPRNSG
jgi:hypothetical protein